MYTLHSYIKPKQTKKLKSEKQKKKKVFQKKKKKTDRNWMKKKTQTKQLTYIHMHRILNPNTIRIQKNTKNKFTYQLAYKMNVYIQNTLYLQYICIQNV